jgi:putative DNA primase/helicase
VIVPFVSPPLEAGCLAHAVALVRSGFQLVLLHGIVGADCTCGSVSCSKGKHPIQNAWQKHTLREESQVFDAFRKCRVKEPNLGIVLGVQPFGAYVLAIDVDDADRFAVLEDELGKLPTTLIGKSARGLRLFYTVADPPKDLTNRAGLGGEPGVDVKVKGGQVVVAPSLHASGVRYTWEETPDKLAELPAAWLHRIVEPRQPTAPGIPPPQVGYRSASKIERSVRERAQAYLDRCEPSISGQGGHDRAMRAATVLVRGFALDKQTAFSMMVNGFNSRCLPPWSLKEIEHKIDEAIRVGAMAFGELRDAPLDKEKKPPAFNGEPTSIAGRVADGGKTADRTDLRNAERLVEWYGENLRYCSSWGKWLAWDGVRWAVDDLGRARECAKEVARRLLSIAENARNEATKKLSAATQADDASAKESAKKDLSRALQECAHAIQTQNASRILAMLKVAESDPRLTVHHEKLDADHWLLNCQNGTVDLRSGALKKHDRANLITRLAPVDFDPNADASQWEAFLTFAMGGDTKLVGFLRRVIGYALTGDVREHVLVFCWGNGGNGKSTFVGTVLAMMGDYATPAPRGLLFRSRGGDRHPTELSTLHGRRFVLCSEVEEGQAFDESLVKDLTGGDPVECRRMREDFWSFLPTHKLWLSGNHKPIVRGDDNGIWRRLRLVPWTVTVAKDQQDKELPTKLRLGLPGILAWAVRGCLEWQKVGLDEPSSVDQATQEYRAESDVLGQWFREHLVFDPNAVIARSALRQEYEKYCEEIGIQPLAARRFAGRLRERGVSETTTRVGWPTLDNPRATKVVDAWRGVRQRTDAEREEAMQLAAPPTSATPASAPIASAPPPFAF